MAIVDVTKPRPHVSLITLNNPNRVNAMSFELVQGLYEALAQVEKDNDSWVVIMNGAGKGFCSGLDLTDVGLPPNIEGLPMSRIAIRAMHFMADIVPTMRNLPQPIIAAVHGAAWGGGFCLTLGADIRLAARVGAFPRRRHQQRTDRHRVRRQLPAAAPDRRVARERDHPDRPRSRCRRGRTHRARLPRRRRRRAARRSLDLAEQICEYSPHGVAMTKKLAVVEPRDRQPRGRDRPREPQSAPRAHDDAKPRRVHSRAERRTQAEVRRLAG